MVVSFVGYPGSRITERWVNKAVYAQEGRLINGFMYSQVRTGDFGIEVAVASAEFDHGPGYPKRVSL